MHALLLSALAMTFATGLPEARVHLDEDRPEDALRVAEQTLEQGDLPRARLVEAWVIKGRAFALLGEDAQAEEMFATALRLDRTLTLAEEEDPLFTEPFARARARLPPAEDALLCEVAVVEADGRRTLELRVRADDKRLVSGARVRLDSDVLADVPVAAGERATYPVAPDRVNGRLSVRFVDPFGNEVQTVELEGVSGPPAGAPARGAFASTGELRWLALGGATAVGLGAVGVAGAGMWMAALDAGDVQGPAGSREVALVGVGVGTGVVALGAGLFVADFLLDPPEG